MRHGRLMAAKHRFFCCTSGALSVSSVLMEVKKRGRGLKNLLGAAGVAAGLLTQLPALAVNPPTNVRVRTGRSAEIKEDDGVNMSFTLDWDDTQTNITKYRVYKSTDGTTFVN